MLHEFVAGDKFGYNLHVARRRKQDMEIIFARPEIVIVLICRLCFVIYCFSSTKTPTSKLCIILLL